MFGLVVCMALTDGQDGNSGLVDELVEHQNQAYLSRLSRTFSAIPVSNIATNVGGNVEQVITFIDSLIQRGLLNARLDDSATGKWSARGLYRLHAARSLSRRRRLWVKPPGTERKLTRGLGAVLRFYLDPTQGPLAKTEKQQQQALFEQTQRTNALAEQVKDADYRLSITKEYVEFVKRQKKKNGAGGGGGGSDAMDVTFDDGDVDEDIMSDMR